jgi:hypothetical protein
MKVLKLKKKYFVTSFIDVKTNEFILTFLLIQICADHKIKQSIQIFPFYCRFTRSKAEKQKKKHTFF